ncbi:phosphopantetheine-binding protein [Streptomyces sp. MB09-01]|uniref:phosphopantetheine-binding protein n=1 Tax=Streptomyces sp. MB09-01 TaxID=3028666 RepID=UPI0029A100FB|nr:phosphopantetheine-binding protein [Streptomyces sp. MB09-01]MDX3536747.1 phosphopantetheine-binding protein [Streptomyces sp. MB09-01]
MTPVAAHLAQARDLLRGCLRPPSMSDLISDTDLLAYAGVDSLATIQLIARCEAVLDRPLTPHEAGGLDSITAVAELLATSPAAGTGTSTEGTSERGRA